MESGILLTEGSAYQTLLVIINTAYLEQIRGGYNSSNFIDKLHKWQTKCGTEFFQNVDNIEYGNGLSISTKEYLNGSLLSEEYGLKEELYFGRTRDNFSTIDEEISREVREIIGWVKFKLLHSKYSALSDMDKRLLGERYGIVWKDWVSAEIEDSPLQFVRIWYLVTGGGDKVNRVLFGGTPKREFHSRKYFENVMILGDISANPETKSSFEQETERFMSNRGVLKYFGVALLIVGVFGLVGNGFCILVLSNCDMRNKPFNILLIGLAVCDIFVLVHQSGFAGLMYISEEELRISFISSNFLYFVGFFTEPALLASTYFAVALSVERYLGICHPNLAFKILSIKSWVMLTLLIPICSIISHIPTRLRYECVVILELEKASFIDCGQESSWGKDKFYKLFVGLYTLFLKYGLPILLLTSLNYLVWLKIRTRNFVCASMSSKSPETSDSNNNSYFKISFTIVVLFLLCCSIDAYRTGFAVLSSSIPNRLVYDAFSMIKKLGEVNDNWTEEVVSAGSGFLIQCNSAVHFVVYWVYGSQFRSVFSKIFCKNRWSNPKLVAETAIPLTGFREKCRCGSVGGA